MGTWDADIFGNDTSCEIKEYFYDQYNLGKEVKDIENEIKEKFSYSLTIKEDKNNVLFALAYCLWEVQLLSQKLFNEVTDIVASDEDLDIWKELDASEELIVLRKKYLQKFIKKISEKRKKAKKRIKPPKQIDSIYKKGMFLSFQYPDGNYGGVIIIDCEFYKTKGNMRIACTDIIQKTLPDLHNFLNSHLTDFEWENVSGQAQKFAAFDNKTARIFTYPLAYENKDEKEIFFDYNNKFFSIAGELNPFTQCLLGTSGGFFYNESYEHFSDILRSFLFSKYKEHMNMKDRISKKNLNEMDSLLYRNKN